ncbi:hypothetical protein [Marinomonas colpomeniae]|uniref:DUF4230 domain-containing protein n=1 Tax=Marinomonas colpomeniae TaxID=2774408 RepID=A0ABR8NVS5_9GAMM|nr:hypothetical protein [Marinomonas colpomeniae]MBD5770157.1 hypothetical protein [Marinomonas colpomeniae]
MWRITVGLIVGLMFLGIGAFIGKQYFGSHVTFTTQVERMRDDVVVSHERDITMYYHVCPKMDDKFSLFGLVNRPPELFIIFPSTLKYKLSLKDLAIKEEEDQYLVTLGVIQIEKPFTDTGKVISIVTDSKAGTAEERYEDREKSRATDIASYLTLSQLESDVSIIKKRMEKEVLNLLKAILNTNVSEIKKIEITWNDANQNTYIENEKNNIKIKPPFGVQGCNSLAPEFTVNGLPQLFSGD